MPQSPVWDAGSPFRGLEVFDSEHGLIFFGRTTAIGEVLAQIRRCAERVNEELSRKELAENSGDKMGSVIESDAQPGTDGNSSAPATFLLVSGMSGVGKSSLIRAGVLPLFAKEGVIEGVNLWRHAIFRPSDATGDLLEGFVRTIADAAVVPELAAGGVTITDLVSEIRKNPTGLDIPIAGALAHAAAVAMKNKEADLRAQLDANRQQGRTNDVSRIERELKELRAGKACLLLIIDQLEEIFTVAKINEAPETRKQFISMLACLARTGRVWIIATMRSDFFARCAELPELMQLKQGEGHYDLLPPTKAEIGQIIRQPASAAGLRYETYTENGLEICLDEVI